MRYAFAILLIASALWPVEALAVERFIPLGHAYSPEDPNLPALNSPDDRISAQVDIFESEIYVRQKAAKEFQNNLDHFQNTQNLGDPNTFIDY